MLNVGETAKQLYTTLQELMILDAQVTREEEREVNLSSPAKESVATSESKSRLVSMSEEEYQLMKATNWEYLHKVFPEMLEVEIQ